ncbi:MAG: transaldolase family protein [Chloroflexi bacterium]|nr:transaldolase family protein [Chloroflexota bacterium]
MDIFLDTAKLSEIREIADWGILRGVTTNPTLMARAGRVDYKAVAQEICYIVQGPVSAEVLSTDAEGMIEEAKKIAQWSPHVVVKIPTIEQGLKAINQITQMTPEHICVDCPWQGKCDTDLETARELADTWGIRVNATLVFNASQALFAAMAGASYVSPFVGRLDEAGNTGMEMLEEIVTIFDNYDLDTEIISASIRHPRHLIESALAGAHIATVPYGVLKAAIYHPMADAGLKGFLADWEKVKKELEGK